MLTFIQALSGGNSLIRSSDSYEYPKRLFLPLLGKDVLQGRMGLNPEGEPGQAREEAKSFASL